MLYTSEGSIMAETGHGLHKVCLSGGHDLSSGPCKAAAPQRRLDHTKVSGGDNYGSLSLAMATERTSSDKKMWRRRSSSFFACWPQVPDSWENLSQRESTAPFSCRASQGDGPFI